MVFFSLCYATATAMSVELLSKIYFHPRIITEVTSSSLDICMSGKFECHS